MSRLKNFMTVILMSMASQTLGHLYPLLHDRTGAITVRQVKYAFLHECLTTVRTLESKRRHDKIYGVLGIFKKIWGDDLDTLLQPDYSLPIQEVFTRVAWLLLCELPNLSILSSVEDASQRRLKGLLSWVPDWTSVITNNSLAIMLTSNAAIVPEGYQGYRERTGNLLHLNGSFFNTITDFADSPQISAASDIVERLEGPIIFLRSAFEL